MSTSDSLGGPPHADDWWRSTDDALDYAHWLDRRAVDLDATITAGLSGPHIFAAAPVAHDWAPWFAVWRGELAQLDAPITGFFARLNSWDRIRTRHAELVELRTRAAEAGLAPRAIEPAPGDALDPRQIPGALGDALDKTTDSLSNAAWMIGGLGLVGVGLAVALSHGDRAKAAA